MKQVHNKAIRLRGKIHDRHIRNLKKSQTIRLPRSVWVVYVNGEERSSWPDPESADMCAQVLDQQLNNPYELPEYTITIKDEVR